MADTPHRPGQAVHTQGAARIARTRDGRALFYMQLGPHDAATPTAVFEAGMAATRSWWALVQPAVAERTRTVVYDRSGLGRSAPDPQARSVARMADDLNDLLDHLGDGPFVLVAHSGGGPIVRSAAAARPERIAGLVLAEVTDEACDALFEPSFRRLERIAQHVSSLLARLGLLAALYRGPLSALPADAQDDMRREGFTVAAMRTRRAELTGLVDAMNRFRERSPPTPDIPITLISGALSDAGMSPRVRAAANAAHGFRAAQSARGRHVVATASGHNVPITEPEVIVEEILRLL